MTLSSSPKPGESHSAMARFLIVDDDPDLLQGLADALRFHLRVNIDTCSSPWGAMERLRDGSGYDVVITDLTMPSMNGLMFIQKGHSLSPHTSFVLITAHNVDHLVNQAKTLGAEEVIFKPFERSHLIESIRDVLRHRLERHG